MNVAVETEEKRNPAVRSPEQQPLQHESGPSSQGNHPQNTKRKHRRGKPKAKNANKPYKKTNWKFQAPRFNYGLGGVGAGGGGNGNRNGGPRAKLVRSRSLVPYNTNKFLMEEHACEVPSATGRTRDSSFSVDSEDNYFYSLPEDEEEFLTKEFANVYEKARLERLENLTKEQLIEECLQIEDSQGTQRQQQQNIQRISAEYLAKIRVLEEKVRELSKENYNLRLQMMRSNAAAAASPPSATAPTCGAAYQPTPMVSSSEDSESDSSTSSSSSSSSSSSNDEGGGEAAAVLQLRRRSCSSQSSLSECNEPPVDNCMHDDGVVQNDIIAEDNNEYERQHLLDAQQMDDEEDVIEAQSPLINDYILNGHIEHQNSI